MVPRAAPGGPGGLREAGGPPGGQIWGSHGWWLAPRGPTGGLGATAPPAPLPPGGRGGGGGGGGGRGGRAGGSLRPADEQQHQGLLVTAWLLGGPGNREEEEEEFKD